MPARKESTVRRVIRGNIIHRRLMLGMSQREVAEELGISQAAVSTWETPTYSKIPSTERLFGLAAVLKTTVAALTTPDNFVTKADIDDDLRHVQVRAS